MKKLTSGVLLALALFSACTQGDEANPRREYRFRFHLDYSTNQACARGHRQTDAVDADVFVDKNGDVTVSNLVNQKPSAVTPAVVAIDGCTHTCSTGPTSTGDIDYDRAEGYVTEDFVDDNFVKHPFVLELVFYIDDWVTNRGESVCPYGSSSEEPATLFGESHPFTFPLTGKAEEDLLQRASGPQAVKVWKATITPL